MDRYSIFEQSADIQAPKKPWTFPADDGKARMAEPELAAALQLLAERARYLTGASGVSIGLRSGTAVVCRASAGPSALKLGSRLSVDSGVMRESLRLRQILRCNDVDRDSGTSSGIREKQGIRSAMVGPLLRQEEEVGAFELLAERAEAFEERDVATMQRLSDLILTALEHFDAARQPLEEASNSKTEATPVSQPKPEETIAAATPHAAIAASASPEIQAVPALKSHEPEPDQSNTWKVRRCQVCGFPVSEIRTLCLDCEDIQNSEQTAAFLGHLPAASEAGWLQSHLYTMGTLFIAALTVALLVLKLR